ncbi:MAG: hypothetical protein E7513_01270 [Ruminococcaceae bacterium]|nr:hypothetical protein [Oscillospiraceae bacterium]
MKKISVTVLCVLMCVILLCESLVFAQAKSVAPSETDPFVSNYYLEPINQEKPFFDVVLPEIEKNIKTNNKNSISPYYDKLPLANNPENFQGLGSTSYANINGKVVTAEAFYRVHNESLSDPNNGMGLLIYQCIQYKRAHPQEDVKITFSSYRTSVTAAVCVLPQSKYYGYMRSLYGTNYDEHGFVRISFMLTEAARMGIEVTMINQLNSYAVKQYNPKTKKLESRKNLSCSTYFNQALDSACYDTYAAGKKVSDFMNFTMVDWTVEDKTSDMQHVKSATVSHYLATDGTEHTSTVFVSSANLDENNYIGCNGNNSSQSGVIISDHDELYRVTYNYMKLMYEYRGQEEMFELRKLVNEMNDEQASLIKSGRGDEIPSDKQIIYLGTENDPVFEMYFTPFGGSVDTWDTEMNPICKYVNKLPSSSDYIEFIWNEYGYGKSYIGTTMSKILEKSYSENPNPMNKFAIRVTDFDTDGIQKLALGRHLGYRSINDGSNIHSKDILMSYEENDERHNVSLMTSCNFYPIAFSYRTNSLLVINETEKTGGDFYEIFAEKYSDGMINNSLMVSPSNLILEAGQTYKLDIKYSGNSTLKWTSSNTDIATIKSGKITTLKQGKTTISVTDGDTKANVNLTVVDCLECAEKFQGLTFNTDEQYSLSKKLKTTPLTFESTFTVDADSLTGTTTLFGSDGNFDPALVFSLNKSGQPRVAIRNVADYSKQSVYVFNKVNVATGDKVHLSIVMDFPNKKMHCYVNGKLAQTITGVESISSFEEKHKPVIGGDYRGGNATYFTGNIESIAVWSDVRTSNEIAADYSEGIDTVDKNLLAAYDLSLCQECMIKDLSGNGNNLEHTFLWQNADDVVPVTNYDYSFAVVGDTQTMCENDPEAMEKLYDWIVANKDSQKIEYVIGLGDITDESTQKEWEDATSYISKLDGKIPYSLSRGNHDNLEDFNKYFHNGYYENTVDGVMTDGDLTNSYRYFNIKGIDYMIMTLDFAPSGAVLKWANDVIKAHPDHKVIITTHAYLYRDGTTLDSGDCYPPTYYKGYVDAHNGDDMWKKSFSQHENVLMVLSGHDPWQHIVYRQDEGIHGNTVTQMLIDAQYVDLNIGSTAMVAMFYFSDNGNTLTVRYYSVEKECYGSVASQFTIKLNDVVHSYSSTSTDATLETDGIKLTECSVCGDIKNSETIYKPTEFTLSTSSYTYDKKAKKPTVKVKDSAGNTLSEGIDYLVSYESGRTLPGRYTVKITFRGDYSGTKRLYFTIKPRVTSEITASQTTSTVTLKWNKVTGATGYRIYKLNSSTNKYEHIASVTSGTSYKNSKLKAGTTYKFKLRAYTKDDGVIWGSYSSVFATATKPKTPTLKVSSSSTKGKVSAQWSNVSGESGYQLYYSTSSSSGFKKVKSYSADVLKGSKSSLVSGRTYYFKVRAYKKVDGKVVYGGWSKVKSIKAK